MARIHASDTPNERLRYERRRRRSPVRPPCARPEKGRRGDPAVSRSPRSEVFGPRASRGASREARASTCLPDVGVRASFLEDLRKFLLAGRFIFRARVGAGSLTYYGRRWAASTRTFAPKRSSSTPCSNGRPSSEPVCWRRAGGDTNSRLLRLMQHYLTPEHRDGAAEGCPLPSTVPDVSRGPAPLRRALARVVERLLDGAQATQLGSPERERALAMLALSYGGLSFARALRGTPLSDEMLAACAAVGRRCLEATGADEPGKEKRWIRPPAPAIAPKRAASPRLSGNTRRTAACGRAPPSMTGHLLGAAGAVEAIISVLALTSGRVPPCINLEEQDPECALSLVANRARERRSRHVMSNAFGFGGTNASLVFSAL